MRRPIAFIAGRRRALGTLAAAAAAAALGLPARVFSQPAPGTPDAAARAHDWDWLCGNWDVWHSRLKERLVGDTRWEEFAGKSAFWRTLDGLGNVDDNTLDLPDGIYRGLSVRAFDPVTRTWAIWWLDGRNPTHIDPPVRGGFDGDVGIFTGKDVHKGTPITARFTWRDVHGKKPWWEQAFSTDDGGTWEVNWRNWFTRTAATATPLPRRPDAPGDFDFLVGRWKVQHRRLRERLVGSDEWQVFDGTLVNWPVLGGHGNIGDNEFRLPDGTVRGMGLRAFDPASRQWSSWWLDGRSPANIGAPVKGGFVDGVGTFVGEDRIDDRAVRTRVLWTNITKRSARWEQSASIDGGATWESNWVSDFTRVE
jgi:hypothetical protein